MEYSEFEKQSQPPANPKAPAMTSSSKGADYKLGFLLFCSLLLPMIFSFFARSINYPLLSAEYLVVMASLFFVSLCVAYICLILRFSKTIVASLLVMFSTGFILDVFFLKDVATYLNIQESCVLFGHGNLIIAFIVGIAAFFFVQNFKALAYYVGSFLMFIVMLFLSFSSSATYIPEKMVAERFISNKKPQNVSTNEDGADSDDKFYIHIVLSNHIGYAYALEEMSLKAEQAEKDIKEGFSVNLESISDVRFVEEFYKKYNFIFLPRAYPMSSDAQEAMAAVVNFGEGDVSGQHFPFSQFDNALVNRDKHVIYKNKLFDLLKKNGFDINVYQSADLDYCHAGNVENIARCVSYASPIGNLQNTKLSLLEKEKILLSSFVRSSRFLTSRQETFLKFFGMHKSSNVFTMPDSYYPASQLDMLENAKDDMLNAKADKNAYFLHVALPYSLYMYDDKCNAVPAVSDWVSGNKKNGKARTRSEIYKMYVKQLKCTYTKLDDMMEALKSKKILDNAIVFIHGDTGVDIQKKDAANAFEVEAESTLRKYKDSMSTVAAIYDSGYNQYVVDNLGCDVPSILRGYLNSDFGDGAPACRDLPIQARDEKYRPQVNQWFGSN
ncbi:MAG: acyltransferase [Alphaproteobacteria bacterium]|nr:acyltransferase [Alphaproteobacteria bacterium]